VNLIMIRLAIDRNHLDRNMVRRSLCLLTRIFCLFCHNTPHLLILTSLVAVYYYNYVEVSSYNKKVQASRNTSLLPLEPTMNVIMQINKIIQTIVGADLSRTSPIDRPWVDGSLSDVFCVTSYSALRGSSSVRRILL